MAMSIYSTIVVVLLGVGVAIFNACLNASGYIPPVNAATIADAEAVLAENGWLAQLALGDYIALVDGTFTIGIQQPDSTLNVISFLFVGLEVITGIISAVLLAFVNVEKTLTKKQTIIRERQKKACEDSGKVWVEPEVQIEMEQKAADEEAEEIYRKELKERCEKKGLDYNLELEKHIESIRVKEEKQAEKEKLAKIKAEEKEKIAADKQADKLAKMTPEQRAKRDARMEKRRAREDAAWEIEREKGERTYNKMQAMLKEYLAAKKGKMKE